MTTSGLAEYLAKRIGETVENPIVRVELVNFKVQVTGDVKDPQTIKVSSERFTILDAIAAAGDFNVSGRRDNVLVIREEDGEVTYHRIDLSNSKALESPYYYLRQNDVIYVEPGQLKKDELTYSPRRTFNVSLASILVSSASVIASLVIAFAK
jgi:polysaccharide export outer membrane protein